MKKRKEIDAETEPALDEDEGEENSDKPSGDEDTEGERGETTRRDKRRKESPANSGSSGDETTADNEE